MVSERPSEEVFQGRRCAQPATSNAVTRSNKKWLKTEKFYLTIWRSLLNWQEDFWWSRDYSLLECSQENEREKWRQLVWATLFRVLLWSETEKTKDQSVMSGQRTREFLCIYFLIESNGDITCLDFEVNGPLEKERWWCRKKRHKAYGKTGEGMECSTTQVMNAFACLQSSGIKKYYSYRVISINTIQYICIFENSNPCIIVNPKVWAILIFLLSK